MSNAMYIGAELPAASLPDGYTQLAYVESDGTQYINTNFAPDNNTRVVCDVVFPVTDLGTWLFGARPGGGQYCFLSYQNQYRSDYANSTDDEMVSIVPTGRFTVDKNKNVTYINGDVTRTAAQSTFSCTQNLYLFACNQSGVANGYGSLKLYACKIYDNDTLVRDYVPCQNAQGVAGLYDLVNDTFSTSGIGMPALIAGPSADNSAHKVTGMYIGVNGLARKVVKGYIGAGGLARQFYSAAQPFAYAYTGAYTESEITIDGVAYTMLTITGSGTLTVNRAISADVWLCGGGGNGSGAGASNSGGGGGGGYIANTSVQLSGDVACVVGAAAGATSLGNTVANAGGNGSGANGGNGASGGGAGAQSGAAGTGAGMSTIPADFALTDAHCAGGGGGAMYWSTYGSSTTLYSGGNGGSNGAGGSASGQGSPTAGAGGEKGGGAGGNGSTGDTAFMANGYDATFYGSGGGGGGSGRLNNNTSSGTGGSGYQGVLYIRWEKEDAT